MKDDIIIEIIVIINFNIFSIWLSLNKTLKVLMHNLIFFENIYIVEILTKNGIIG